LKDLLAKSEKNDFWSNQQSAQIVLKEISSINKKIDSFKGLDNDLNELIDIGNLYKDEELDEDIAKEIESSLSSLKRLIENFEVKIILSGKDDSKNAILSINSGAGGTEAQDWASMLSRMYMRYSEVNNFKAEFLDFLDGEEAGIKNCSILIQGDFAYGYLKNETGVHRLVRISPFDSNKRRHTSFASVSVSPEVEIDIDIQIQDKDLRIDTFRAAGAGGQHINKTDSAVRITHIPSGIVVGCQNQRSQHQNRNTAMKILSSKLYDLEVDKIKDEESKANSEKKEIGWGSQVRSYILHPYRMVKDHRIDAEIGDVDSFLDGSLQGLIEKLLSTRK
jgi:peptide chain release factor 2